MADGYSGLSSPNVYLQGVTLLGVPEVTFATTGDKLFIDIPFKCRVLRSQILLNAAPGDAGVVVFDRRPLYASDTDRGSADGAPTLNMATTHVAGNIVYKDATSLIELNPGDQVVVEVTDASAAVTLARAWILVREVPEVAPNQSDMKAST